MENSAVRLSPEESRSSVGLARDILKLLMQVRRAPHDHTCDVTCPSCHTPHLAKVIAAVEAGQPVVFVLPAFPGKSPNLAKVLGSMPDMAEQLALQSLQKLCDRIKAIYAPGAHIVLCSDGRVFSDVVGMNETDVTEYQHELDTMIAALGLNDISTFNLDETYGGRDYAQMRVELMTGFGVSQAELREKVVNDEEANRMYRGITRFLVEDSTFPGQTKSRTQVQKECKVRALEVIRRSNAWSEFISHRFPEAVRLSIHPQVCGSIKLGIQLVGTESWMTPWHGVAVKTDEGFVLLKRSEAEALGAQLVSVNGRPSHFEV